MASFVELEAVKRRLRIFHDDDDQDLSDMIAQGQNIVMSYINKADPDWTVENVPPLIQAAILLQVGIMWADRGDGDPVFGRADGYLDKRVTAILQPYKRPVLR